MVGPVVNPKAVDTPSGFIRRSQRLAEIARCAQYGDCDFRRSPRLAFKIADIWSTRYRRLNSPAFAKSARSRDFLSFLLRVAGKINQSSWAVLWQWLFKMAEGIDNCFWTEEKEINLIILWSEKPCLFDVLPSGYSNRLKKDSAFQYIHVFDHIFLLSHFSERFLERFSCKIMAAANNFFGFAVVTSFVYIGSHNFYTSPDGTWDQGWMPHCLQSVSQRSVAKMANDFRRRSNSPRSAYKIAECVAGFKQEIINCL